ncbi:MAG: trigger factor [Phycisphaerae bacterium]|nr:trigger factor [Phycisphaerae bacterium]
MPEETKVKEQTNEEASPGQKQSDLPEIGVAVEEIGTLKKRVTVKVPRGRIDAKYDEMFGELGRTAQVPGFRIGRAPRRLIEKRFGKEILRDVRNAVIGESLGDAVEKTKLKTLGEPDLDLEKIELPDSGDMEYSFEVEVAPEFDLPDIKGIKVEKLIIEVNDERIDQYIEQLRLGRASFDRTGGAAAEGDVVLAGAKITAEGLEPLDRPGLTLRVAPGQIEGLPLVDLDKDLTGRKTGDTISMTVKAPAAHPNESWREKEITIELTLSEVRRRKLPRVDRELASQLGFDSLKELRNAVAERMTGRLEAETQRSMREQVSRFLLDKTDFQLPEGLVTRQTANVLQRSRVDMMLQGMPREQIDSRLTELQAAAAQEAQRVLKLSFILGKIAEDQTIEVGDDEVNARIAQMASSSGRRPERLRQELAQDGSLEQVRISLRDDKVLDKILSEAKIVEVVEGRKKEGAKGKAAKPQARGGGKAAKSQTRRGGKAAKGKAAKPKARGGGKTGTSKKASGKKAKGK